MADTLVNMNARMEIRGIALERFAQDLRQRGQARSDGVTPVRVAARRAVIASRGVQSRRPREISSRTVLPGVTPGLSQSEPPGVVNLTEFVFLAPDQTPADREGAP